MQIIICIIFIYISALYLILIVVVKFVYLFLYYLSCHCVLHFVLAICIQVFGTTKSNQIFQSLAEGSLQRHSTAQSHCHPDMINYITLIFTKFQSERKKNKAFPFKVMDRKCRKSRNRTQIARSSIQCFHTYFEQ